MDGHNTGVPFAGKMSPPVADLSSKDVQGYSDGQLKVIIESCIRFTGMPSFKDILEENEMWHIVRFIRHLPPAGSAGIPAVYLGGAVTFRRWELKNGKEIQWEGAWVGTFYALPKGLTWQERYQYRYEQRERSRARNLAEEATTNKT